MEAPEHICSRMIQVIERKGLVLTNFEEKWKNEGKISVGYLSSAAKSNRNIGIKLIEYFIEEFPEVDVNWLLTGKYLSRNTGEKNGKHYNVDKTSDNGKSSIALEDVLTHLIEGDTKYILMNKELILEKYRLVSIDKLNEEKLEADRKHQELLEELRIKKDEIKSQQDTMASILMAMTELVKKLPGPPPELVKVDKA